MAIPGGWLLTSWGATVARAPTLDALLERAVADGLAWIEHRTARRTGDSITVLRLEPRTVIHPAKGRPS